MESPFSHLLNTNHAPSSDDARRIKALLVQRSKELPPLDDEINRLQISINGLEMRRKSVKDFIDSHEALLSPVRQLPPEIIAEIFVHCLPTKRNPVKSVSEAPLLLGRVCSQWRHIALTTPRLWSSLHLVIPTYFNPQIITPVIQARCEAVNAWLGRSGTLPLTLSLVTPNNGHSGDTASPLLKCLIKFSARWKSVDLRVPYSVLRPFSTLRPSDVPNLEILKIDDIYNWDRSYQFHFSLVEAPRLRILTFYNFRGDPQDLLLSSSLLTELSLDTQSVESCLTPTEALRILRHCPNITSCCFGLRSSDGDNIVLDTQPITLPKLRSFRVLAHPENSTEIWGLFDNVIALKLKDMTIRMFLHHDYGAPLRIVPFQSFLTKPSLQLESLAISYLYIRPESLIACLELLPMLTSLSITDSNYMWSSSDAADTTDSLGDALFRRLISVYDPRGTLCPRLERVTLTYCASLTEALLLEFVQCRWPRPAAGISALKNVEVRFSHVTMDIAGAIAAMRAAGLKIVVDYPAPHSFMTYSDTPWDGLTRP